MRREGKMKRRMRLEKRARKIQVVQHVVATVVVVGGIVLLGRNLMLPKVSAATDTTVIGNAEAVRTLAVKSIDDIVERATKTMSYSNHDNARLEMYEFITNISDWCTDRDRIDIDYLHTLTVDGTVVNVCKSSNEINNNKKVSHISVKSNDSVYDMWYNIDDDVYLVSTPDDSQYNRYENNDDGTAKLLQKNLLMKKAQKAFTDTVTEIKKTAYKSSINGVTGALEVSANGLLDDIELPTHYINEASDRYRVYILVEEDVAYLYIHYDYTSAQAQSEDYFYCLTRRDDTFDMPEDIKVSVLDTRVNVSVEEYLASSVDK